MPQTKKISKVILRPLLEDHNKIAGLINHLDQELETMIDSHEPDTAFIEISIMLLNEHILHYHTLEKDIVSHFEQYKLNVEEKLKVMTLFKEHRESLPLLEKLLEIRERLEEESGESLNKLLIEIRDVCDELHRILHEFGKKYFANVLLDETKHVAEGRNSGRREERFELDIDGEVITDELETFIGCHLENISEGGMSVWTEKEYAVGEHIAIRCNIESCPLFNCEVLRREKQGDGYILSLKILNYAECNSVISNLLDHDDVV